MNCREAAGCDLRARCTESMPGNVQCSCKQSGLQPATDFSELVQVDGSLCAQPHTFEIAATTKRVQINVRKPLDSTRKPFQIVAKGDSPFDVNMQVMHGQIAQNYLSIVDSKNQTFSSSNMRLSRAKPEILRHFFLHVIGNRTSWADAEERNATVQVSHGHSTQDLTISVLLTPYPSCTYTTATLIGRTVSHKEGAPLVLLAPQDAHNFSITKTEFRYAVRVSYERQLVSTQTLRSGTDNKPTPAKIADLNQVEREGQYQVTVDLVDGWDHDTWTNQACRIASESFSIFCAEGMTEVSITDVSRKIRMPSAYTHRSS